MRLQKLFSFCSLVVMALAMCLSTSAVAQVLVVTATGSVTSVGSGFDASVHVGTAFTETFAINLSTPLGGSGTGYNFFTQVGAAGSVQVGDYTVTSPTHSIATIYTNYGPGMYGYQLDLALPANHGFSSGDSTIYLESSTTPAVAPTTTLSDIKQFPLADFDEGSFVQFTEFPTSGPSSQLNVNITSYTVSTVPEPGTWVLLLTGLALFLIIGQKAASRSRLRAA